MNVNGNNANAKLNANVAKPTLKQWVAKMSDQIKNALPANITPERMMRIALTALSKDTKLANSTPESFMGALLTSAQLGLECNTPLGQAYLIPFRNKGVLETQFQLGYQGIKDLIKVLQSSSHMLPLPASQSRLHQCVCHPTSHIQQHCLLGFPATFLSSLQ